MPDIIGLTWDSTTGPRVIEADPVLTAAYSIIVDQQRRIVELEEDIAMAAASNDVIWEALKLKEQECEELRAEKCGLRRSLLRFFGSLER